MTLCVSFGLNAENRSECGALRVTAIASTFLRLQFHDALLSVVIASRDLGPKRATSLRWDRSRIGISGNCDHRIVLVAQSPCTWSSSFYRAVLARMKTKRMSAAGAD
jgi:hypothetical protein